VRKDAVLDATITQVFTREEIAEAAVADINTKLQEFLTYDEYAWQYETKQAITYPKRAEGIENVLYMCPVCRCEFQMATENADIFCRQCGEKWHMTEYGRLEHLHSQKTSANHSGSEPADDKTGKRGASDHMDALSHIPGWYEWERSQVIREIEDNHYSLDISVHIDALPNAVNFIDLKEGVLRHDKNGFALTFTEYGEKEAKTLCFPPHTMTSVHTEYDYRGKGQCITLSTLDNTYFLFPRGDGFNVTKIQFAAEYLYEAAAAEAGNRKKVRI